MATVATAILDRSEKVVPPLWDGNSCWNSYFVKIRSYDGLCSRMAMVDHCRRWDEEWGLQTSRRKAAAKSFQLSVSLDARQTNFWAARQKDSILNLYGSCVRRLICTKVGDIKSNFTHRLTVGSHHGYSRIFESSYSNNFAKEEGLDTKPATPRRSHVGLRARRSTDLLVGCSACLIDGGRSIAVGR